jgi:ComF family protein
MARAGAEIVTDADLIVPVPLHRARLWWRRFNQSAALAFAVGTAAGKPVEAMALKRVRATRRQVGLGPRERQVNVRGAFRVADRYKDAIAGRKILLVDDVYTTGATAKAVTRLLKRAGAADVDVLVFARVARNEIGTIY